MVISAFITANTDYVLMILFALVMTLILVINRKKVELQKLLFPILYLIMYKTTWGLKKMDTIANKLKKHRDALSYTSITLGFIGMILMTGMFLMSVYKYFFIEKEAVVAPLLPGATIPGLPTLSFVHWIIAIFVLATVHEFSHGIFARMYNIKIKSSGFAFFGILLPIIPAAFVEPDEKQMATKSKKARLAVLSAGTFSNFIFAGVFFLILSLIMAPLTAPLTSTEGVVIVDTIEGGAAFNAEVQSGEMITHINGVEINTMEDLTSTLDGTIPYERLTLETQNNTYQLVLEEHPDGEESGYMGINLGIKTGFNQEIIDKIGMFPIQVLIWLSILTYWLFLTNLMVGLVNLLPIGIVDGGLMFHIALGTFIKNEKTVKIVFGTVSIILLLFLLFFLIPALFSYFISPFS
jgi:membrane-associated protease RseP (regulator of RpoE activity)